ncbi:diol dehydratase small subunit [Paenochrobactrum glaciei]|uniref:Glycerol dehydratase n=1 Tax=Paenochrobactrum glaciei TaxID=486407 RepID=A0ABN1GKQ8_9HYPH
MNKVDDIYPVSEKSPEKAVSVSGLALQDLTLEAIMNGQIGSADIRISADVLKIQAEIAQKSGRETLAKNFERAADLVAVPEAIILQTYEMLRPGRVLNPEELSKRARFLREKYGANAIASLIDEAVLIYKKRRLFRKRY